MSKMIREFKMRQRIHEYFRAYRVPYNHGMLEGLEKLIQSEIEIHQRTVAKEQQGISVEQAQEIVNEERKKLNDWYEGKL